MKLSIVATLYRSATTIDEFYRRAMAAGEALTDNVELILVNDGSPDDSRQRALALYQADPRVVVVDLARNFGHHKAMMTGLMHARGDLVFLLDSDLEEEPELLARFHQRLSAGDCDVVYGVQEQRRGGWFEKATGALYFSLLDALSDEKIPHNLVTARLMTRDYVRALIRHRDREFVMSQLWSLTGFRQIPLPVKKLSLSPSSYSLGSRAHMAIKHITTTSTKLLYLVLCVGLLVFALSGLTILYYFSRYMIGGISVDGWTSLIVSVWFFGGLITLILGILGIYIANLLSESKRRPYAVIRHVYRTAEPAEETATNVIRTSLGSPRAEVGRAG
jgi:putative glycosyltransferase